MAKTNFETQIEYELGFKDKPMLILRRKGSHEETVHCPYCGSQHTHGKSEGHRIAHCQEDKIKYKTVHASDGTVLYQEDGYIIRG